MDRLRFSDVELTYDLREGGARVVLVHASPFVSWYGPLLRQLTGFSTLTYRRHLRAPDDGRYRALTVAEDAATCVRLMAHVGWPTAHIVGHSYGALVALQMAIDAPDRVGSVALLEPAARGVSSTPQVAEALQPVLTAYQAGDKTTAVDGFLRHVCGEGYRPVLDHVLPHAFREALVEADLFFQSEMAAVRTFSFSDADAQKVAQPVLNVTGADSVPRFIEGSKLLQSWFPHAETFTVPAAGHLLMVQNPTAVAQGLRDFFDRHPITDPAAPPPS